MSTYDPKYESLSPLEHILKRSGMYIGSCTNDVIEQFVFSGETFTNKNVSMNPGLYKLYDEICVNAADQVTVDATVKTIKIDVNVDENYIEVFNDGRAIPIVKDEKSGLLNPSLIFGVLHSGSNFDDTKQRYTGGTNGLGGKLANVFSKRFELEVVDAVSSQKFTQAWTDNMSKAEKPKVRALKGPKTGHVKIRFYPDLERFGLTGLHEHQEIFQRRAYDISAMCPNVKVSFNGDLIKVKNFERYADMFLGPKAENFRVYFETRAWKVTVAESKSGFRYMSFVNGIATYHGGTHVDHAASVVSRAIISAIENTAGFKSLVDKIKPSDIKQRLFLLVSCQLPNPTFSSQTKEFCTLPYSKFPHKCDAPLDLMKKFIKSTDVAASLMDSVKSKEMRELSKTDGVKKTRISIPKLDDANWAGTRRSHECTLIVTEGDSAKTFAISGLSVVGRDKYGVFPLRGKLLNTREASSTQIANNAEISNVKQILGLKQGYVYTSLSELRYGKLLILADSDDDGLHIRGLVANFIADGWPELVKLGFVCAMLTPVVRAFRGRDVKCFFSNVEYEKAKDGLQGYKIRYYKGLGTNTSQDAKEIFMAYDRNVLQYSWDDAAGDSMELAFKKTESDRRKEWILESIKRNTFLERNTTISGFVNQELVQFSISDVRRSIPSAIDGLKPSQRKILFAMFKRNVKEEMKVAQLSGMVGEVSHYHHGEMSLNGAIVGLAQNFIGSNQTPLLEGMGQFGTRLMGGKDSASPRYIYTRLSKNTRKIFPANDDPLLKYMDSDGYPVEPEFYVPVLPMILVNGGQGIGTGFSTSIPSYKIEEVKANVERRIRGEPMQPMVPHFEGFKGTIARDPARSGVYIVEGCFEKTGKVIRVTELPLGTWTENFKDLLDKLDLDYTNHSTETDISFDIRDRALYDCSDADIVTKLKLRCNVSENNMYLFDHENKIKKYDTPLEIIVDFVKARGELYAKRKGYELENLEATRIRCSFKRKFLEEVMNGSIEVFRKKEAEVETQLVAKGYPKISNSYEYCTHTRTYEYTADKLEKLDRECEKAARDEETLRKMAPEAMWLSELTVL